MDHHQVVTELVRGRILVPSESAIDRAGRCASHLGDDSSLDKELDLIAHEIGWIWAVYYVKCGLRTHVAFIHADGQLLAPGMCDKIVGDVVADGDSFAGLSVVNLKGANTSPSVDPRQLVARYYAHLAVECGDILLDGLPADNEIGTRRLRLERLFVPLHLEPLVVKEAGTAEAGAAEDDQPRVPVGRVLDENNRLAILAAPGGGKSTLIKRIAMAYSDPSRRPDVNDGLPDRQWLPILVRCRELGDLARAPMEEVIRSMVTRLGLDSSFVDHIRAELQSGRVLLLIDGSTKSRTRVPVLRLLANCACFWRFIRRQAWSLHRARPVFGSSVARSARTVDTTASPVLTRVT